MKLLLTRTSIALLAAFGAATACRDGGNEPAAALDLKLELVAQGLTNPVYLTAPSGDTRLFIVERAGVVRLVKNGAVLGTPFLDIRSRVNSVAERGLLSITFDPSYATNGWLYAYYTNANSDLVLERIGSTPGSDATAEPATIIMTIPHGGENHHGGEIAFGPDGMLYIAPGDGGCCGDPGNRAQNLGTWLGKVLRIDVRTLPYTIPAGNPFVATAGAKPEIWAYGLRNPWRFSFDAPSATLYIGDVGQDAHEEIDAVPANQAGVNYGWRLMEGFSCYSPASGCDPGNVLTRPVVDYPHSSGCSVIGGYVYRGSAIPELVGHYLYSDFCAGWLRSFRRTSGGITDQTQWPSILQTQTVSLGRDGRGELYMIGAGRVWRIVRG
ncbi:MAG TPA: PQQ-dependent sugar dehydrogenase [Gemmatimonadaceae bacterium]|nr:PQQ-dependent sugar dehydrogenase [Gemmatimonadaceae bacterium]